jgi:hypothetical protein
VSEEDAFVVQCNLFVRLGTPKLLI